MAFRIETVTTQMPCPITAMTSITTANTIRPMNRLISGAGVSTWYSGSREGIACHDTFEGAVFPSFRENWKNDSILPLS